MSLTLHIDAPDLLLHRAGIDLAHVAAPVGLAQLSYPQPPRAHVLVHHADPDVVRDDSTLQGQHGLVRGAQPAHLVPAQVLDGTR